MRELERDSNDIRGAPAPLAIIGRGRVGGSLAAAAESADVEVLLAGRRNALEAARRAEVALLTVPDAEIPSACEALAPAVPPLRFIGHTSGATGLGALSAATASGASAFSIHPLQTVPEPDTDLTGAPCAVAGSDEEAVATARSLARLVGMRPFTVPEEMRAAYHAAASIASNFLVALEESAVELLDRAGIADGRELLAPLVLRTAANWSERGAGALTGPIARGDEATVARHIDALREVHPELLDVYLALAGRARDLATGRVTA